TFLRDFCTTRGLAISWLIVGIVHPCSRETRPASQIRSGPPVPSAASREFNPRKAKSRQPLVAERKALRRHRGPRSSPVSTCCPARYPRSCIRNQSRENLLK